MPLGSYALCSGIPTLLRCLSGIHILSLAQREKLVVSRRKWQDSCTSPPRHLTPPGRSRNEDMCPNLPYVAFSHSHSPKSHNVTSLSLGASNPSLAPSYRPHGMFMFHAQSKNSLGHLTIPPRNIVRSTPLQKSVFVSKSPHQLQAQLLAKIHLPEK